MNRLLTVMLILLGLGGCRAELNTLIKVSQLNSDKPILALTLLKVDVDECQDPDRPSQPSKSLRNMQTLVADMAPQSQYKHCYTSVLGSVASFSIPVAVGKYSQFDGKYTPGTLYLTGGRDDSFLSIGMAAETKAKIIRLIRYYDGDVFTSSMQMKFHLDNDTGQDINNLTGIMLYADYQTFLDRSKSLPVLAAGKNMQIVFSDVLSDALLASAEETQTVLYSPAQTVHSDPHSDPVTHSDQAGVSL